MTATVALVKAHPGPGEIAANAAKVLHYAKRADKLGAAVVVFPELMLTGIGPAELGAGDDLRRQADEALTRLAETLDREGLGGRYVVVGTTGTGLLDLPVGAAAVLHKGTVALDVTDQDTRPVGVFAARGLHFGLALGQVAEKPQPGAVDAILVVAQGLAYVTDPAGRQLSPPRSDHEGLTLWTAKH